MPEVALTGWRQHAPPTEGRRSGSSVSRRMIVGARSSGPSAAPPIRHRETEGITIIGAFVEVKTGKGAYALDRRPQFAAALSLAKQRTCPVPVAKLDRLSRDIAFISGLMARRLPFVVAELGRRPVHAPPLRGLGREGAPLISEPTGQHYPPARLAAPGWATRPTPLKQPLGAVKSRCANPSASPPPCCRLSNPSAAPALPAFAGWP